MTQNEVSNRLKNALILLPDGYPINIGELTLLLAGSSLLKVIGWTVNNYIQNVTKTSALTELKEIKNLFSKMINISPQLSQFIKDKQIEFCLSYNYGMGAISICSEKTNRLIGKLKLKKHNN
ncbi:MAG TPA: hypothetical protein VIV35_11255 [Chitinophagaceae bacterium]